MMNILCLYNATQTYTNAVYEHLHALSTYSDNHYFFCHVPDLGPLGVDLARFDSICVHFSVRLPYDQLPELVAKQISHFGGLKFLFIQDEYDNTHRTWWWIHKLGFQLVFTVVPDDNIETVYPRDEFPNTRFVTNLTGYAPKLSDIPVSYSPPSTRSLLVGYRGRVLPVRYGMLGFEKVEIGRMVKSYCNEHGISNDISWAEEDRIYGSAWNRFVLSCRSMLGTESGSNVFDWDSRLETSIDRYVRANRGATNSEIYLKVIKANEISGLMNQISPKMFEAVSAHTVLVLFEGNYSGILQPDKHFIPLLRDGSNLQDVIAKLQDGDYVDEIAHNAYTDVIVSGRYDYCAFANFVDNELNTSRAVLQSKDAWPPARATDKSIVGEPHIDLLSTSPIRAVAGSMMEGSWISYHKDGSLRISVLRIFLCLPRPLRNFLLPVLRRIKKMFVLRT